MKANSIFTWIKNNKLTSFLTLVLLLLFLKNSLILPRPYPAVYDSAVDIGYAPSAGLGSAGVRTQKSALMESADYSAGAPAQERMVATDTSISIKVEDVSQTMTQINQLASQYQGYMVNQNIRQPEEGASGNISIRVKSDQLENFLESVRNLGIRVVSETVSGRDITDQYTNIEERMRVLATTKNRFEEILNNATEISDMLEAQRELLNLQSQIDSLEGQRRYLLESSDYSLVSVYLATDEMALPYAPAQAWSPKAIFRQAVRSLVTTGRGLAELGIWAAVYSPIWLTALAIVLVVKKKKRSQLQ
ncbi:MAG: hypothetical protein XD95_0530 [Microgenomates bacterium 39_7]|nr:MAG: hypothetical protein XD95_0530 [Microgenomates bacterium 39_7]